MENIERWIGRSAMSDTGRHAVVVAELPSGIGALNVLEALRLGATDYRFQACPTRG